MKIKLFVNSPFQVLCAAEFMVCDLVSQAADFDLVLVATRPTNCAVQTEWVAKHLGLPFRRLASSCRVNALSVLDVTMRLRAEVAELSSGDVVVVGNPSYDLFADALARSTCDKRVVLDDGVVSIAYLEALSDGDMPQPIEGRGPLYRLLKAAVLAGVRTPDWRSVHWFTMFADSFPSISASTRNSFSVLRSLVQFEKHDDVVLFLGSPLVTDGLLSKDDYVLLCGSISRMLREEYPGASISYLKHRREAREDVVHSLFDSVEPSIGPVEARWIGGKALPRAVAGVISTALFSLSTLLENRTDVVCFWPLDGANYLRGRERIQRLRPLFDAVVARGAMRLREISI